MSCGAAGATTPGQWRIRTHTTSDCTVPGFLNGYVTNDIVRGIHGDSLPWWNGPLGAITMESFVTLPVRDNSGPCFGAGEFISDR